MTVLRASILLPLCAMLLSAGWVSGCTQSNLTAQRPTAAEEIRGDMRAGEPGHSLRIGAYYYPWYSPNRHWDSGYRGTPVLGEYDSADPLVIEQHIKWAESYGIDFFVLSWWGEHSFEDTVIRGPFLDVITGHTFRFALLYESAGLLQMQNGKIDLDNPHTRQQIVDDFTYIGQQLCQHPNMLKVDSRPVIFLYLTRTFTGDVSGALADARAAIVNTTHTQPYLVGDEVYWQYPDQERLTYYDAVTAYNMHTSVPNIADGYAENVDRQYRLWHKIATQSDIDFVPDILPGFDDTTVRPEANHPVIPRSTSLFAAQLTTAQILASGTHPMLMITSWNEWHENTAIEPTEEEGTAYLDILLASP